tara:strand:+ start:491 stop:1456 length:966 start_codon:yes stop_codon:yes gene_type:complete
MINVAYVFDENFSDATLVSVLSCMQNNQEELTFHLITFEKNAHNLKYINGEIALKNHIFKNYLFDINKVNWSLGRMGVRNKSPVNASFSNATYLKIFIPEIVQEDRVIFIDSDTLVGTCLRDLWENEMEGKMIAGVFNDGMSNFLEDEEDVFGYKNSDYINAGVLLMDLEQLRQTEFVSKCQAAYQDYAAKIKFNDQDLINLSLKTNKFLLPERFNTFAKFTENKEIVNKKISGLKNSILHFIGDVKPWQSWNIPPFCDLWMRYANLATTKKIELTPITNLAQIIRQGQLLHAYGDYRAASSTKSRAIDILVKELNKKKSE